MVKAIILGFIQAVTEFLPVSSSGHLRIAESFLNFNATENILAFEIALHFGTFLATCLVFHKDIINAITGFFTGLKDIKYSSKNNEGFRVGLMVIIASIPTQRVGLNLIITGFILLMTKKMDKGINKDALTTTYYNALMIGFAQAIAVFPGISRSGMTISMALFLGLNRDFAGRFSFLISLPAIFGALLLSLKDLTFNRL